MHDSPWVERQRKTVTMGKKQGALRLPRDVKVQEDTILPETAEYR